MGYKVCRECPIKNPNYEIYEKFRRRYIPKGKIKMVFIGESPSRPKVAGQEINYFYWTDDHRPEEMANLGNLFGGLMRILGWLPPGGITWNEKGQLLSKFQDSGFLLIDAAKCPINHLPQANKKNAIVACARNSLFDELSELNKKRGIKTIAIVKCNVYDILSPHLKKIHPKCFLDIRIPFPGCGWQKKAALKLRPILDDTY